MNFQPSPLQVLVLWKMLFLNENFSFSKSKPKFDKKYRDELISNGFVESFKIGRSNYLKLTDKAWDWAVENLNAEISLSNQATPILHTILVKLNEYIKQSDLSLAEFLNPQSIKTESTEMNVGHEDLESQLRNAYLRASNGRFYTQVRLTTLRELLKDIPQNRLDETLLKMYKEEKAILYPLDDPQEITATDSEAALFISEREKHIIILEG